MSAIDQSNHQQRAGVSVVGGVSRSSLLRAISQKRQYVLVAIERYFHDLSTAGSADIIDTVAPELLQILARQYALRQAVGAPAIEQQTVRFARLSDTELLRLASLLQDLLKQLAPLLQYTDETVVDGGRDYADNHAVGLGALSPSLRVAVVAAGADTRRRTATVLADTYATVLRLGV